MFYAYTLNLLLIECVSIIDENDIESFGLLLYPYLKSQEATGNWRYQTTFFAW